MGYYAQSIDGMGLYIPADKADEAFAALVQAITNRNTGGELAWLTLPVPESWEDALDEMGFSSRVIKDGDPNNEWCNFDVTPGGVIFESFDGKWRENSFYLNSLAAFFTDDSELIFLGEDVSLWRVTNKGEEEGTITFNPA